MGRANSKIIDWWRTLERLGAALGLAALTAVYSARADDGAGGVGALTAGFADALYAAAGIAALGVAAALLIFRRPLRPGAGLRAAETPAAVEA